MGKIVKYLYGEEVKYEYDLLKLEDFELLQAFSCGNEKLDYYIHWVLIHNEQIDTEDGLPFKVWNKDTGEIIAVFSLASSGILAEIGNYTHILPAINFDIFAVDINYQKLHMDEYSKNDPDPDEHCYLSDDILSKVIRRCRNIAEKEAIARFIVLYADKKARRFYERNLFSDFSEFMKKENNMEIAKNDPMYMRLDE